VPMNKTMSIGMLIGLMVGGVHLAGLLALVGCALWAPEGYEDEDGFHLGRQPVSLESILLDELPNRCHLIQS
jgi:hypothetical protein